MILVFTLVRRQGLPGCGQKSNLSKGSLLLQGEMQKQVSQEVLTITQADSDQGDSTGGQEKRWVSRVQWHMSVIPVLGRLRQEDHRFEISLNNLVRPCSK